MHIADALKESRTLNMSQGSKALVQAVASAGAVILCVSNAFKISATCRTQVEHARKLGKFLVPVVLDSNWQPGKAGWLAMIDEPLIFLDETAGGMESAMEEILSRLELHAADCSKTLSVRSNRSTSLASRLGRAGSVNLKHHDVLDDEAHAQSQECPTLQVRSRSKSVAVGQHMSDVVEVTRASLRFKKSATSPDTPRTRNRRSLSADRTALEAPPTPREGEIRLPKPAISPRHAMAPTAALPDVLSLKPGGGGGGGGGGEDSPDGADDISKILPGATSSAMRRSAVLFGQSPQPSEASMASTFSEHLLRSHSAAEHSLSILQADLIERGRQTEAELRSALNTAELGRQEAERKCQHLELARMESATKRQLDSALAEAAAREQKAKHETDLVTLRQEHETDLVTLRQEHETDLVTLRQELDAVVQKCAKARAARAKADRGEEKAQSQLEMFEAKQRGAVGMQRMVATAAAACLAAACALYINSPKGLHGVAATCLVLCAVTLCVVIGAGAR
eukprot:SAG11_NODE_1278_length_5317_cov_4.188386_6_plen_511_part_00